jgi:hypothetical protein
MGNKVMKKLVFWCISVFMVLFLASCSGENSLKRLEYIKAIGDRSPNEALSMLDSLEVEIRTENEYVKYKYDLLRIRLNDKAYKMPTSDIMIKKLVTYFDKNGSLAEKQEVHYYAGSTYRDLQDTPRALEHFFKSLEYANDNAKECDSIMLGSTYSNINYIQYQVQNYAEALKAALKELEISKKTNIDPTIPFSHVGSTYRVLHKTHEAEAAYDSTYAHIVQQPNSDPQNQEFLAILLANYSDYMKMSKAKDCMKLITSDPLKGKATYTCVAFGKYYKALGMRDSAVIYFKHVLENGTDISARYDASKNLFNMYNKAGDTENARRYAQAYMQLSDSMDFGKRQELAATVNNAYQYHLDQKKEQDLKEEKEHYKSMFIIGTLSGLLLTSFIYIINFKRKLKHQKEKAALISALQQVSNNSNQLKEDIKRKEAELAISRESLKKSSDELDDVKQRLQSVNQELAENNEVLKNTEELLEKKKEQNKTFIKLLHQTDFEEKAEDVIRSVKDAAKGKTEMTVAEWKRLYKAVDELHPTFYETILQYPEKLGDKEIQVLYLLRIGLSKTHIMNMTNLARVTVWRWEKRFEEVLREE